ncbi:hypothetical protein [Nostoc sp. FACHB-280]|uniref:hypothetical protein n=1 Tax=Nostoc sp. FACHB-280 TaxID=2692839 RepID=UPI00168BE8AB|nr:hypothetical protein [Nostoc sp. FACHB-280]MBD2494373.1 hypothetical protein [Nostoc sp. FACHB-280]
MPELPKSTLSNLRQYLPGAESSPATPNQLPQQQLSKREPVKHLLIGSAQAVTITIHRLHLIGYASVGDWSPLLPTANPDEVMSILIRQLLM